MEKELGLWWALREFFHLLALQTQTLLDGPSADAVRQQIKALLRGDITAVVLGVIITAVGLSAIALHLFRAGPGKRLLLWSSLKKSEGLENADDEAKGVGVKSPESALKG